MASYKNYYETPVFRLYSQEVQKYPVLTPEIEKELFTKLELARKNNENTDSIKSDIVNGNLRLVLKIAMENNNRLMHYYKDSNITIMDLIQVGNIALMRSVDLFDHTTTFRFCTYAAVAIRRRMDKFIKESRFIHLPIMHYAHIRGLKMLKEEYGDKLTDRIILDKLNITEDMLERVQNYGVTTVDPNIDLDMYLERNDMSDNISSIEIGDAMDNRTIHLDIKSFVSKLKGTQKTFITEKYLDGHEHTFQEIAEKHNCSRQLVHIQIKRGLERIKKMMYERQLLDKQMWGLSK